MTETVYGIFLIFMLIVLGVCIIPFAVSLADMITRPLKEENERNRRENERLKKYYDKK